VGLLSVAGLTRNSWSLIWRPSIRPTKLCERLGAPRFRKICFSCATENVVAQATRSRCCTDVRFGFDSFCSAAVKCECRSSGEARKIRARSGTLDLRVRDAVASSRVRRHAETIVFSAAPPGRIDDLEGKFAIAGRSRQHAGRVRSPDNANTAAIRRVVGGIVRARIRG